MNRVLKWALLVLLIGSVACDDSPEQPGEEFVVSELSLYPNVAGLGVSLDVAIQSTRSQFVFGATSLDLGEGVTVIGVTVSDGYNATATVIVEPDAELGSRDALITIEDTEQTLVDAFRVIEQSIVLDPNIGKMGEIVEVAIVGTATEWEQGYTWAGFGEGIDVIEYNVLSKSLSAATLSIRPDAAPGPRNVSVENGTHVVTKYDGFMVDRAVITAFFEPKKAYQGEFVEFTIVGLDTNWQVGTEVQFWDDGGQNQDIQVTELEVHDAENMSGRMRLSNAARIGYRDVYITSNGESVLVPDAMEVLDALPSLANVAIGLGFDVGRSVDNSSCEISERVTALAYFVIPLDPPCGASPPPGDGPKPFDANGVWPVPPEAEPVDCPNPETVGAGDFVWFESDENVVTLQKDVIASTGQIIYYGQDLTLDDYRFGQWYDLHTQGVEEDEVGIPEVILEDVQPTCPCDFELVEPMPCNDYTHPASEDLPLQWTPGGCTYPNAGMVTQVSGTLLASGDSGFAGVVQWDDGAHQFTPTELGQLQTGPVSFGMSCGIQGPYFGFPFSTIQSNQSGSSVSIGGQMSLE